MNWATGIVLAIVIAVFASIILAAIRKKRKGESSCACGSSCGGCPMHGKCHTNR